MCAERNEFMQTLIVVNKVKNIRIRYVNIERNIISWS